MKLFLINLLFSVFISFNSRKELKTEAFRRVTVFPYLLSPSSTNKIYLSPNLDGCLFPLNTNCGRLETSLSPTPFQIEETPDESFRCLAYYNSTFAYFLVWLGEDLSIATNATSELRLGFLKMPINEAHCNASFARIEHEIQEGGEVLINIVFAGSANAGALLPAVPNSLCASLTFNTDLFSELALEGSYCDEASEMKDCLVRFNETNTALLHGQICGIKTLALLDRGLGVPTFKKYLNLTNDLRLARNSNGTTHVDSFFDVFMEISKSRAGVQELGLFIVDSEGNLHVNGVPVLNHVAECNCLSNPSYKLELCASNTRSPASYRIVMSCSGQGGKQQRRRLYLSNQTPILASMALENQVDLKQSDCFEIHCKAQSLNQT